MKIRFPKILVSVGLSFAHHFHIYDLTKVIIFQNALPKNMSFTIDDDDATVTILSSTRVKVVPLKDYFRCSADKVINVTYPPSDPSKPHPFTLPYKPVTATTGHSSSGLIIGIVVGVLFLLVVIAIVVYFCMSDKEQHGTKESKVTGIKQSGSKNKINSTRKESVGSPKMKASSTMKESLATEKQSVQSGVRGKQP